MYISQQFYRIDRELKKNHTFYNELLVDQRNEKKRKEKRKEAVKTETVRPAVVQPSSRGSLLVEALGSQRQTAFRVRVQPLLQSEFASQTGGGEED